MAKKKVPTKEEVERMHRIADVLHNDAIPCKIEMVKVGRKKGIKVTFDDKRIVDGIFGGNTVKK